jgi:hypothetical protein
MEGEAASRLVLVGMPLATFFWKSTYFILTLNPLISMTHRRSTSTSTTNRNHQPL